MIKVENVEYRYKSGKTVLHDINIDIEEGEVIAIVGKNGSGKSTIAKVIAGLLKPTKGKVFIDDMDTSRKKNSMSIRKKVGMVFQNPENQIMFSNVYDDLMFGLNNLELDNKENRVKEGLQKVQMENFLHDNTYELSLGQKQRVAIASVLAIDPKYIVFDEPTTMLDSEGKEDVYNIISALKGKGYTVIYVTNVVNEVLMADRIMTIEEGRISNIFERQKIVDNIENLKISGIKIPVIVQMLSDFRKAGIEIDIEKWTISELTEKIIEAIKFSSN